MKVLTFVIPAYNSEPYLEKCVSSMVHPELLDKLEIIIVNDGSKDTTPQIGQRLCDRYPGTVRLISQENKGHGGALNTGCAAAQGKYLKVIDADDWVQTQNLPEFVRQLEETSCDVVLTHYRTIDITTGEIKNWKSFPEAFGREYTFRDVMASWRSFDRCLMFHGITYRTEFYHQKGTQLEEHVFYEDHQFATFPCCRAASLLPLDLFIYEYRVGDVNQSVSYTNQLKRIGHTETVIRRMAQDYLALPESDGKAYAAMKTQALLLSYMTTALLVNPDKKAGRAMGRKLMAAMEALAPEIAAMAKRKYQVFAGMNHLHIGKTTWDAILASKLYNRLRGNHDFT